MISIIQLSMRFGAKILFKNVSLQFNPGNRYGLVGANGSGKSTLIKNLTGEIIPESGQIHLPQQVSLGSLSQDHYLYKNSLILDVVLQGNKKLWEALETKKNLLEKENFNDSDCERLDFLEKIIEEQGGYAAEGEAAKLLEGLGIRDEWHLKTLDFLSGGYKLRVLLAQVLFGKPEILILDEPTNHLDIYSIKWLEDHLRNFSGMIIVTSHDREFLNGICTHIADIDYGKIKIYKGNYDAFKVQKQLDREQKEHMLQKHDKRKADLQGFIDRFGAKASKARQAQSKARIVEQLEEEIEELDLTPSSRRYPKFAFKPLLASSVTVLTIKEIEKSFGPKKVLDKVSFEIERGEKVAILGPNGIGKSTLLEILTENQFADQGKFIWGYAARFAYFPQDHSREVKGDANLLDWLGQFDREISQDKLRDILGRVLFSGDTVKQSVSTLSGGETARLLIAKMMLYQPNVLIFDEPTNHLDMEAIEELIEALRQFEGTILLVSHNRHFVSRLTNRIIEISYQGVKDYRGSYCDYLERQSHDYLNVSPSLNQRYSEKNLTKAKPVINSYEEQKKIKSQKAQLRKKMEQAEESCHALEKKIHEIENRMASEGFYQLTTRDEQQNLINLKLQTEKELLAMMENWEKAGSDLQKFSDDL